MRKALNSAILYCIFLLNELSLASRLLVTSGAISFFHGVCTLSVVDFLSGFQTLLQLSPMLSVPCLCCLMRHNVQKKKSPGKSSCCILLFQ